jgi:hypothetical protein
MNKIQRDIFVWMIFYTAGHFLGTILTFTKSAYYTSAIYLSGILIIFTLLYFVFGIKECAEDAN